MQSSQPNKYFLALLAFLTVPISGLSIDIYVPSLPAVSQYFGVDKSLTQLTITVYMIGLGVMQLFAGGISDSFGRKKPFLIAMFAYFVATLFIPFVQNIHQLLTLRFIQGIMVAITVVPMRSVIPDLFEGREYYKMANYMTMAWSIGPIIAPAIGGYLQHYFGWQANFYFLAIYSVLTFVLIAIYLPETSAYKHPFHVYKILIRYKEMLLHKDYVISILINSMLYSLIILFAIVGPFLIQTILHYSAVEFGHIALFTGLAWFCGTMTNRFFAHVSLGKKTKICLWSMLLVAFVTLLFDLITLMNIYLIVAPIIIILWIGGIIFPNHFAFAISLFPKTTGGANALFGGFVFFITGLSSGLGTYLKATTELPLTLAYIGLIGLCLVLYYISGHKTQE
ncbi:MAG: hypothetical protein ACD_45C00574G0001 [uncultured bacterium]|nr:MAG: hypothetical protein ACD_45C00574G0001 [uncultured bacterium]